jgi:hypothetical protein
LTIIHAGGTSVFSGGPVDTVSGPLPAILSVSGITLPATSITAKITGFSHDVSPAGMNVALNTPTGEEAILMDSQGGPSPVSGVDMIFEDTATTTIPTEIPVVSGSYKPASSASFFEVNMVDLVLIFPVAADVGIIRVSDGSLPDFLLPNSEGGFVRSPIAFSFCNDRCITSTDLQPGNQGEIWSRGVGNVWTESSLLPPPDINFESVFPKGISGDGTKTAGYSTSLDGLDSLATLWNGSVIGTALPLIGTNQYSQALCISSDGSMVGGFLRFTDEDSNQFEVAMVWTEIGGTVLLSDLVSAAGLSIPFHTLNRVLRLSGNGKHFLVTTTFDDGITEEDRIIYLVLP